MGSQKYTFWFYYGKGSYVNIFEIFNNEKEQGRKEKKKFHKLD
jgi:hypothetical protein